jgi:YD repeat-containing protein
MAIRAQTATYYADGLLGNNGYDGLSNVVANGHGPKLYIASAISVAPSGSMVSVAAGSYQELFWDLSGKNLTLIPQGQVTVYGEVDSVGDGIPDWWRQQYFGTPTTTNSSSCASCDPSGDGMSNLQDFLAGLDPLVSSSPAFNLFFYDNLGRLAAVVSTNGADVAFYDYDAVGNILDIRRQTLSAVNLLEFSPATGSGNTTVTLQGTGFSPILSNNIVLFGSVTAQVVRATANQLIVVVPTNAVNCLISISNPLGVSTNSGTFTTQIGVSVSPGSVTLNGQFTQQFAVTVYGTTNQNVTWNLNGWIPAGSNSAWGVINTNGFYTAPAAPPPNGLVTVQALSVVNPDPLLAGLATIVIAVPIGPIYSPTVSAQPGIPNVLGPIYSPTVSAQPGIPNVLGPIYSPTISVTNHP